MARVLVRSAAFVLLGRQREQAPAARVPVRPLAAWTRHPARNRYVRRVFGHPLGLSVLRARASAARRCIGSPCSHFRTSGSCAGSFDHSPLHRVIVFAALGFHRPPVAPRTSRRSRGSAVGTFRGPRPKPPHGLCSGLRTRRQTGRRVTTGSALRDRPRPHGLVRPRAPRTSGEPCAQRFRAPCG